MKVQLKIVSEKMEEIQKTIAILQKVFPLNVCSRIIDNDQNTGYHCLMTINPSETVIEVKKQ